MKSLPADPLDGITLAEFGRRLRAGSISSESAARAYLERIALLEPKICAFVHVATETAIGQARAMDRLLASGTDLGPLMGVPVAIKDLFTVDGMPRPRCGSSVDISDIVEGEGEFVRRVKRAGCVILGKTRMTEFAAGLVNVKHLTPWNPVDAKVHRMPGGSSGGSAAALAAGMCAFSIGSDTGGSVRHPAAMCGLVGYKSTYGWWPTDGAVPLSTTLDSIGTFTRSAADAALVYAVLSARPVPPRRGVKGLRLGRPDRHYFEELAPDVSEATEEALRALANAGVEIVPMDVPETAEIDAVFGPVVTVELLALLGRERFLAAKDILDPIVWNRAEPLLDYRATDYVRARRRLEALVRIARERMRGLDGWVTATTPDTAVPLEEHRTPEKAAAWIRRGTRNTRPGNMFGQCAVSLPIAGADLPVGLQIVCAPGEDERLLSISQGVEERLGVAARADMSRFL
ncbi:MAG TPA: amidase [Usitatibacter sp.]|nr:amidase [Usitatibacter sp.]